MGLEERRLPVPEPLRRWVDRITVAAYLRADECPLIHAPDPATVLVWRRLGDGQGDVRVMGPRTQASYHHGKDIPVCVRLRIRPGQAPALLGRPAGELVNRAVALSELWGRAGDRLVADLESLGPDAALAVGRLQAAILARAGGERAPERARSDLVRAAAVELSAGTRREPPRIREVARYVGVSERHLRDVFTATVGVSPKRFTVLNRIRTVVANAGRRSWARLAADAGYYDQSHMTAEFHRLMHVTPNAFAAGRLPTVAC